MGINGLLNDVRWTWTGTETTADLLTGATVLPVLDPECITEEEFVWIAATGPYEIAAVDVDAATFTITPGLSLDVDKGTEVATDIGGQPGRAWVAEVILADADEPVEVPLTIHDLSVMPEGGYDPLVAIVLSDDLEKVENLPGSLPVIDGVYIPSETLPPPPPPEITDGIPPASSPTTTLTPLYSTLMAQWPAIANADLVGYQIWLDGPDFVPTQVGITYGTSVQVISKPDGSPLQQDVDYTVWVVAFDDDGEASPGTSDTAQLSTVTQAEIDQAILDDIEQAQSDADAAQADAAAAASAASTANANALAAAGLADSKGKVIIQNAAPAVADQLPQNLWIDTTGGANTPKRWTGSAWTAVTDKVAVDAANAAAAAQSAADAANAAAAAAATAAGNAQTTANGKNTVWYQATAPAGTGHKVNDVWYDTDDGYTPYQWDGDSWEARPWGHQSIATVDAGKITVGFLAAARIAANTINVMHMTVGALSDNAIGNPGYEDSVDATSSANLVGWTTYGVTGGVHTIDTVTEPLAGAKSLLITKNAVSAAPGIRSTPQPIPLASGKWSVSVRARANVAINDALTLRIQFLDVAKATIAGFTVLEASHDFLTGMTWDTLSGQFGTDALPVPANAKYFVVDAFVLSAVPDTTQIWLDGWRANESVNTVRISDGAVSAVKVGADVIVANDVYGRNGYFGAIAADQINSGLLDATIGLLGSLEVGPNIRINPAEGILITLGTAGDKIQFPADGSPATVTAGINAKWLNVEDNLSIRGNGQILGTVSLSAGITDPGVAPLVTAVSRSTTSAALVDIDGNPADWFRSMVEWPSGNQYLVGGNFFDIFIRYMNRDATYSHGLDQSLGSWKTDAGLHGMCLIGTDIYLLVQDYQRLTSGTYNGKWYIYRIDTTVGTWSKTSEIFIGEESFFGAPTASCSGALANVGGLPTMIWQKSDKVMTLRRYNVGLTAQVGTDQALPITLSKRSRTQDAHYGPRGAANANRIYVAANPSNVLVFTPSVTPNLTNNPTWTRVTNEEFLRGGGSAIRGIAFDTRSETGTTGETGVYGNRFQSISSNGKVYEYGRNVTTETVRAGYAWYDGVGTTHKTKLSPEYTFNRPARAPMQFEAPAAPDINNTDPTNNDKANQIILYGAVGETPKQQSILAVGTRAELYWNTLLHTGSAPSATNEFEGAGVGVTAGIIQSTVSDARGRVIKLEGPGNGRVGPLEWVYAPAATPPASVLLDTGTLNIPAAGTFTGSLRFMRIGQMVWVTGGVGRATSFQTGFTNVGLAAIPAEYRPSTNKFGPGCVAHANSAGTYQFRIDTDGTVNVRQGAAITIDMQCNFAYFIN